MDVRSQLPRWAQGPTQKFIEKTPIKGTNASPLTEDSFVESFKRAAGAAELAGADEIPREDNALGQPGVVSRNGLNIYYQGDTSNSRGEFEAVLTSKRRGVEYVTYVHAQHSEYSVLRMVNDEGDVDFNGTQVKRTANGLDGYLVAGYLQE
jgi:hypothetical protein